MPGVISKIHLGVPFAKDDGQMVILAIAHAALTAYQPYAVVPSINTADLDQDGAADNDGQAVTKVPTTLAVPHWVGCPQKAYAIGEVAELVVGGAGKCLVTAGAVTAGLFLEVLNTGTAALDAGAHTTAAFAAACEANGSAAKAINVQFMSVPVVVAAS